MWAQRSLAILAVPDKQQKVLCSSPRRPEKQPQFERAAIMSYISAISITTCAIYDCEGLSRRHCPCVWFSSSLVTTYAHNRALPNGIRDLVRRSCNPATCKHRGKMWMGCQELQRCDVQLLFISRGLCICGHTSCSWGDSRGIELIKKHRIQKFPKRRHHVPLLPHGPKTGTGALYCESGRSKTTSAQVMLRRAKRAQSFISPVTARHSERRTPSMNIEIVCDVKILKWPLDSSILRIHENI